MMCPLGNSDHEAPLVVLAWRQSLVLYPSISFSSRQPLLRNHFINFFILLFLLFIIINNILLLFLLFCWFVLRFLEISTISC